MGEFFLIFAFINALFCFSSILFDKLDKRHNTLIGKLSLREYHLIDSKFRRCEEDFTDENLKELGALVFAFIGGVLITEEEKKEFIKNKICFWKKFKNH